jgi:hypothetical protein
VTTERSPERRVWLWAPRNDSVEVIVVGPTLQIAPLFALIKRTAEDWPGWERVSIIVSGMGAAGIWAAQTPLATYDDPIAEALLMFGSHESLRVVQWTTPSVRGGAVGEW